MGAMIKIKFSPEHQVIGTHHDLHQVMLALELWGIPGQEHTIITGQGKPLEPLLIIHINHGRCISMGVVGVYRLASPCHAMEQGK